MILKKSGHTDVVVSTMLSTMPISWDTLRELERTRGALMIDPGKISESLEAIEERIPKDVLDVAVRLGEHLISQYSRDESKVTYSFSLLEDRLWEMPYFTRPLLASEIPSLWYAFTNAYPWTIFLMITDPSL